jgi:hypothetical protein
MEKDRREYSRIDVSWPVNILTFERSITGALKNISLGGALIVCRKMPHTEKPLELSIQIPNYLFPVSAVVQKVRMISQDSDNHSSSYELAVRFTEISEDDFRALCNAIESATQARELPPSAEKTTPTAANTGVIRSMEKLSRDLNRPFRELLEEAMCDLLKKYEAGIPEEET